MKIFKILKTSIKRWTYLGTVGEDARKIVLHANVAAIKLREGPNDKIIAMIVYYKESFYYVRIFKSNWKMYVDSANGYKISSVFSWLDKVVDEKLYQEYQERELVKII